MQGVVYWTQLDALSAYYQINIREEDQHKTTFVFNSGRYFFRKTVMGNRLSSDSRLMSSDDIIKNLPGVYKLVKNQGLPAAGREIAGTAGEIQSLGMTLASSKV